MNHDRVGVVSTLFFYLKINNMGNKKGDDVFTGCFVTIACGFVLTILLIGAVDSCKNIDHNASKTAAKGFATLFMWGSFWVVIWALFKKD